MRRGRGPQGRPPQAALGRPKAAHGGLCPSALRAPAGMLQKPDEEMPRNFSTTEELRDIMRYYSKRGQAEMQENFYRAVYAAVRRIPAGKVATYGQIAMLAGSPGLPALWAGHCTATPNPAKRPATGWYSGMAAWRRALPLAGLGRSGRCWKRKESLFCRTGGWIWPGTSGPAKMKRCNIG